MIRPETYHPLPGKNMKLTTEEKELHDGLDPSKARPLNKVEREKYTRAARNTLKKSERINIRLTPRDLGQLKHAAIRFGIPYQTLITSILHRYVSGELKE